MANSALATYRHVTPHRNRGRSGCRVCKITPHYMAAKWTGRQCADYFATTSRQASSNYCIGHGGDVAVSVDECDRAWTSASKWNDDRAITIECANEPDSSLTDATWEALVELCADVCRRHGFRLEYDGTKNGSLTEHRMFAATSCPGAWLHANMGRLAREVNVRLDGASPAPGGIEVDGLWGDDTTLLAQRVCGTPADGEVWHQPSVHRHRLPGCTLGWKFDASGAGSPLMRKLQGIWGAEADGLMGPDTINAMIAYYRKKGSGATLLDGKLDRNSKTIKAFQRELNAGRI